MGAEGRIGQLEKENVGLRAKLAEAYLQITQQVERLQRREAQLAKDNHTSLKPPPSDGPVRQVRSQDKASGKKIGGKPLPVA